MSQGRNPQDLVLDTPRRVIGGFVLAISMVLIVGAVTLVGLSERTRNVTSVERTFSVLQSIEELATDVSASQLALAEFLATGDHQLLQPYEKARHSVPELLRRLRELTVHRPLAHRQVEQLEPVLIAGLDREAREIAARRHGASVEELRPLLAESKGLLDRSAALLDDLKEDTALRLDEEQRALSDSMHSAAVVVVIGDAVLLALIVAAAVMSMRDAADKARAVQFQRRVLGMVGHDLRNPLSVVTLSADQLARSAALSDRSKAGVNRIVAAANRMDRLIRDLLDCSRIELGIALPLEIRKGDADKSCLRIVEDFRTIYPTREIQYQGGDVSEVDWDPDRIEQVLENLVGNALKYSPERTPVRLGWTRSESEILIEVANDGAPIPRALLPHVFEPFQRGVHGDRASARNGVGLGLYIVRQIVKQHGGSIDVQSSAEDGTRFILKLPQAAPARAAFARRMGLGNDAPHDAC
jgi:signal transduction histidine kinase